MNRQEVQAYLDAGEITLQEAELWRKQQRNKYLGWITLGLCFLVPPLGLVLFIIWLCLVLTTTSA